MKYYLIPIEQLKFKDEDKNTHIFLEKLYSNIYKLYSKGYLADEVFLELLKTYNLPTHFLFQSKKNSFGKTLIINEAITDFTLKMSKFDLIGKEVNKLEAIAYLKKLTRKQMITITTVFPKYVYNDDLKIIPFPIEKIK